jgi:hypothetical protein
MNLNFGSVPNPLFIWTISRWKLINLANQCKKYIPWTNLQVHDKQIIKKSLEKIHEEKSKTEAKPIHGFRSINMSTWAGNPSMHASDISLCIYDISQTQKMFQTQSYHLWIMDLTWRSHALLYETNASSRAAPRELSHSAGSMRDAGLRVAVSSFQLLFLFLRTAAVRIGPPNDSGAERGETRGATQELHFGCHSWLEKILEIKDTWKEYSRKKYLGKIIWLFAVCTFCNLKTFFTLHYCNLQ